ncbi:MAG TPA: xanthine dehydrogenase family protein subunit M [Thermomicrobiales bacterium]|nr:xanthine dehydrogenase family protein subunit M [Thermomicrobiales bacterium]
MYPAPFTYHRATSVSEALSLLQEHADTGKLLAGGHSLLPIMKLRLAQPEHLIDISGLEELRQITFGEDVVTIGALVTHRELATNAELAARVPLFAEMANVIGDQQVRNLGTIGGVVAHADPAADYPAGMLVLDVTVLATGSNGEREIPIGEFFQGFLTTALAPDELLTGVRVPLPASGTNSAYEKLANPASGYATVGVAAVVSRGDDGTIGDIRVGITGASDTAWRATSVEDALRGTSPDPAAIKAAAASTTEGVEMLEDKHAPADYRARVTRNLVRRAIERALA